MGLGLELGWGSGNETSTVIAARTHLYVTAVNTSSEVLELLPKLLRLLLKFRYLQTIASILIDHRRGLNGLEEDSVGVMLGRGGGGGRGAISAM